MSLGMVFINANSAMSGKLGDPRETVFSLQDWEGCLEVASVAWLLLPGRCLISKAPRESALFEAKRVRIGYLIQSAVAEDLDKGFVTGDYHEVLATLCKVARLL